MIKRNSLTVCAILFRLSILGMFANIAIAGLCMMYEDHDTAFKCLCGALGWAGSIFIFDALTKRGG